jgi:hypothetical protein
MKEGLSFYGGLDCAGFSWIWREESLSFCSQED